MESTRQGLFQGADHCCCVQPTDGGFSALRLYGHRWATWVALMLAFSVTVVVPFLVILGWLDTFTGLYLNRPYFRVANHFQILLFGIVESILLGVLCTPIMRTNAGLPIELTQQTRT